MAFTPVIFRVIVSVHDIERAADFYGKLFDTPGRRVSPGRHYFDAGNVILACYDPEADGDETPHMANPEPIYFSVSDVDGFFLRCQEMGLIGQTVDVYRQPWGERSFYMQDPFGNPLCFVEESTCFTGLPELGGDGQDIPIS